MAYAKIIQDGNTLIDLTQDTVNAESMLSGTTAHKNDGTVVTGTIQNQAAQTIIPTTTDQTIASGKYLTGTQTIKGDSNLLAANIAKDVTIFGVTGTHEGGGGGGVNRLDLYANCTPTQISSTVYVDQAKSISFLEHCNYDYDEAHSVLVNADVIYIHSTSGDSLKYLVTCVRYDPSEPTLSLYCLAGTTNTKTISCDIS